MSSFQPQHFKALNQMRKSGFNKENVETAPIKVENRRSVSFFDVFAAILAIPAWFFIGLQVCVYFYKQDMPITAITVFLLPLASLIFLVGCLLHKMESEI